MARAPRTITEQAAANLIALEKRGVFRACLDATAIVTSLHVLAELRRENGRMPTQAEYAERRGVTDRQARRHYAEIRRAFPLTVDSDESAADAAERVSREVALLMDARDTAPSALSKAELSF